MRPPTGVRVIRTADEPSFIREGARMILEAALESVNQSGSTPKKIYAVLARGPYRMQMPWNETYLFWGDERCVPPDHPESNYLMTRESLLSLVTVPASHVFRMPGEARPAASGADMYEKSLRSFFGDSGFPAFDLILLGLGEDGHTASLFPGTAALGETARWVTANHVPKLESDRLTMTFPVLNAGRRVVFLCAGESKAPVLQNIFDPAAKSDYPAGKISPQGSLTWLLDDAAASKLPMNVQLFGG
jgi:6-phosphogluconolactonase